MGLSILYPPLILGLSLIEHKLPMAVWLTSEVALIKHAPPIFIFIIEYAFAFRLAVTPISPIPSII